MAVLFVIVGATLLAAVLSSCTPPRHPIGHITIKVPSNPVIVTCDVYKGGVISCPTP